MCTVNIQNESTVILQQLLLAAKVPATFAVFLQGLLLFNSSCDRYVIAIDFKIIKCPNAHIIVAKGLSQPNTNIYWLLVASMLYITASACLG